MLKVSNKKQLVYWGIFALSFALSQQASAQTIPSTADVGRSLDERPLPEGFLDLKPKTKPNIQSPQLSPEIANREIVLRSLKVQGMTAFSDKEIEPLYNAYLGQKVTVAQLFTILVAVQTRYMDAGYTLSRVIFPSQPIESGNVYFQVTEGYVNQVEVDADVPHGAMIDDFAARIVQMKPLNVKALERMMLILNDRPGLSVTSILATDDSGKASLGAVRLILRNNDSLKAHKRIQGQIDLDNEGSNYAGAGELSGNVMLNNTGFRLSDLSATAKVAGSIKELKQAGASYHLPLLGVSGLALGLFGDISHTQPGYNLNELDVVGNFTNFRASLEYPVIRQRSENLFLTSGFNYKNSRTNILGSLLSEDRVRSADIQASYSFADAYAGINQSVLKISRGFDILNSSKTGTSDLSRQDGRSDFTKAQFSISRTQGIGADWGAYFSIQGQYSANPLLAMEEFGFGGPDVGRGYDSSEITGDRGVAASFEVRHNSVFPARQIALQPFVFWDIGKVWNIDPSDTNTVSGSSVGAGVRMEWWDNLSAGLTFAQPLTLNPSSPLKYADESGTRILFHLTNKF